MQLVNDGLLCFVNRRIGGLEKSKLGCLQVASVNRRIGGLENHVL